jgi:hypothetical protein
MVGNPVDAARYAAAMRDADPRLREPRAGPLPISQPTRVDDVRASRFAAYRARIAVSDSEPREPAAAKAGHRAAASVSSRLGWPPAVPRR